MKIFYSNGKIIQARSIEEAELIGGAPALDLSRPIPLAGCIYEIVVGESEYRYTARAGDTIARIAASLSELIPGAWTSGGNDIVIPVDADHVIDATVYTPDGISFGMGHSVMDELSVLVTLPREVPGVVKTAGS
jgi:hypothetical protein